MSEDLIRQLTEKLLECEKKRDEYLAGWQRAKADFINYKKEELERIEGILKFAGDGMALKLLPILDNFDLAEKELTEESKNDERVKGVLQIKTQIVDFLKKEGVEEIKTETGDKFDPKIHEATEEVEAEGEAETISEVVQKGYTFNEKILRPAKVKVVGEADRKQN